MVSETVTGVIVGGAFTLGASIAGGVFAYYTNKMQTIEANKRHVSEFYLERKVEILTEHHANVEEIYNTFNDHLAKWGGGVNISSEKRSEEDKLKEEFDRSWRSDFRGSIRGQSANSDR